MASLMARSTARNFWLHWSKVASLHITTGNRHTHFRQFGVVENFSKQLKGEAKSNEEFQRSTKELKQKVGVVTEDFKIRTKKTMEKLYKSMDGVMTEAESATKKVSANVKEGLSAAKEEISANVKNKFSAAKEEVRETFGLGKEKSPGSTPAYSSGGKDESGTPSKVESSQNPEAENIRKSQGEAHTMFGRLKSTLSGSQSVSLVFQKLKEAKLADIAKKVYNIVREELKSSPSKKRFIHDESTPTSSVVRSSRTDIVLVPSKQSRVGERWEEFKTKVKTHPIFKRVSRLQQPVQEFTEDLREQLETRNIPVVDKIQDISETVFGENPTAHTIKEIRYRDPSFNLPDFVAEVQQIVKPILTAYFKGDVETLKKYCSSEVLERCKAEQIAYAGSGIFFENKILHISDVDVRETKMMGSSPVIIIGFQTQQIYCVRDREGSVTAGGKDTIQTVYYAWAMIQRDIDELEEGAIYPLWKLREMQQIGVQALI